MQAARAFVVRTIRAVRILARDGRIPRPLRGAAALGLMPIPGPFDEAVLLVVGVLLWAFYRERLVEAWRSAEDLPAAFATWIAEHTGEPPPRFEKVEPGDEEILEEPAQRDLDGVPSRLAIADEE